MSRSFLHACMTAALLGGTVLTGNLAGAASGEDWPNYGNDRGAMRYSPLTQITPANVGQLVRAFEFRTGDLDSRRR